MAKELPGVGVNPPPQLPVIEGPQGPPGPATMTTGGAFPSSPNEPWMHYRTDLGLWFFWNEEHLIWESVDGLQVYGFGRNWIDDAYMRNMFGEVMDATYGYISRLERLIVLASWAAADTAEDGSFELRLDGVPEVTVPFTAGETGGGEVILDHEVGIGIVSIFQNGRVRDPLVAFYTRLFLRE
ncbi:MAG: hypothetical protein GY906_37120 [bacterium]|nr:hypothetical protein [bacterium]